MTSYEIETRRQLRRREELAAELKVHGWTWQAIMAIFCLTLGALAAIFGSALTVITWMTGIDGDYSLFLHRLGTVLLFLTIPLILVGAHCLDLQESASKRNSKRKATSNQ